jgi:DeoR/GlpR family transcriptional regulator of sugar metabolism
LLNLLQQEGQLSVRACSDTLGVSEVTIRNDLAVLEREGLLQRTWGGAMLRQQLRPEGAFMARLQEHRDEKERIAVVAAQQVHDNDTIFLDASTTAYYIAQHLKERQNLTIITNGMYTALELGPLPTITTIVLGGQVRGDTGSLVGTLSADLLAKLHVGKGFFSARGLTLTQGLMESTIVEGQLKELVISHVDQVVAVLDASKLGSTSLTTFCPVNAIRCLITSGDEAARKAEPFRRHMDVMIS